jgi:hypothetical protein
VIIAPAAMITGSTIAWYSFLSVSVNGQLTDNS